MDEIHRWNQQQTCNHSFSEIQHLQALLLDFLINRNIFTSLTKFCVLV